MPTRALSSRLFLLTACTLPLASVARAHFVLEAPACYSEQTSLGFPLKSAPCGQADPSYPIVPTDAVTTLIQGGMLTVTIDERVFHPGHYRIAIAPDIESLPPDPPVTPGATPCGSTMIDPEPAMPVLADGVLVHTAAFDGPQTIQIPLPADFTCDHCVVQVIEFMSSHPLNNPGGCFYHHCADVRVVPPFDAGPELDAGVAPDGSTAPLPPAGCGCRAAPRTKSSLATLACIALGILAARRRSARAFRPA